MAFRHHWATRIQVEGLTTTSANRELTTISGIFTKLYKLKGFGNPDLFKNLSFGSNRKHRPPYEEEFIRCQILPALNAKKLNQDAANVLRILINTVMRPSEVTGLAAEDMILDTGIPYVAVRPRRGRELKAQTSMRDIPLVGIAFRPKG